MSVARSPGQAGFSAVEMLVVMVVGALALLAVNAFTRTTTALASQARAHMGAERKLRANLQQICNVLRGVDLSTLDGFDSHDRTSTAPTFERVVGLTDGVPTYSGPEGLAWRAAAAPVEGVSYPGGVWLSTTAGDRLIAPNVPLGGFVLRQDGDAVLVTLTVYHRGGDGRILEVRGETCVAGRNDS